MANPGYLLYRSIIDDDGDQFVPVTLTSAEDQREKIVLAKPCVIPVLFLPGIMGTNLRKKNAISHRGEAFRALAPVLRELLG